MKKEGTTNKNMIFVGVLVISIISIAIVLVANVANEPSQVENNFIAMEGAVAGSFDTPESLWGEKSYDTLMGSKKAKLKILVYEDYSNLYSAELAKTLNLLVSEYKNDLAIISRPFIATNSIDSHNIGLAYLCANDMGRGEEMRSVLLDEASSKLASFDILSYARNLKLNEEKFRECLLSEEKLLLSDEIKSEAKASLVLGSPTMLIGGEMIMGARPYADFVDSNGDAIEGLKTVVKRHIDSVN